MAPAMTPQEKKKRWNLLGVILQVVFFLSNAYVWIIGLACLLGGFMLGFNSRTIILHDFQWLDYTATTPATIFITYGILMIILTSVGCFASTSGNKILLIIFIVFVVLLIIFDLLFGIWIYFNIYSLPNWVDSLKKSLHGYGVPEPEYFGIIPVHPMTYWDHVQLRARCCGVYEFWDWYDTPIGKNWSLPDSCCNEDYEHEFCGELLLRHPDTEHHTITNIVNTQGLMMKFPKTLRKTFTETGIIGITVGAAIIFCCLFAIVLLCLVTLKKYKPGGGPESRPDPNYKEKKANDKGDGPKSEANDPRKKSWPWKKNDNRVRPEPMEPPARRKFSRGNTISNPEMMNDDPGANTYMGGGGSKRIRTSGAY